MPDQSPSQVAASGPTTRFTFLERGWNGWVRDGVGLWSVASRVVDERRTRSSQMNQADETRTFRTPLPTRANWTQNAGRSWRSWSWPS